MTENLVEERERFTVADWKFERLEAEIEVLNKRARKLGVAEIEIVVVREFTRTGEWAGSGEFRRLRYSDESDFKGTHAFEIVFREIEIVGETPKFAGWTFLATAERVEDAVFFSTVPGESVPVEFRDTEHALDCDHCGYSRRRNRTFVVRHENGEHKRVGSTCIKDFLGHTNPLALARMAEWLCALRDIAVGDDDDFWGGGYGGWVPDAYGTESYLAHVAASIRNAGWLSKGKAWELNITERATANCALDAISGPGLRASATERRHWRERNHFPTEEDTAKAERDLAWIREHFEARDPDSLNDYEHNLRVVTAPDFVKTKHMGVLASMFVYVDRALEREREVSEREKALAERRASVHFGAEKERLELTLTVDRIILIPDRGYGDSFLHKFITADGNAASWFASRRGDMEEGGTYRVKGTVKGHDEYKGVAETKLNRVTVLDVISEPEIKREAA